MQYTEALAHQLKEKFNVSYWTMMSWKYTGHIPDKYLLDNRPLIEYLPQMAYYFEPRLLAFTEQQRRHFIAWAHQHLITDGTPEIAIKQVFREYLRTYIKKDNPRIEEAADIYAQHVEV